jgi:hypothetical protein
MWSKMNLLIVRPSWAGPQALQRAGQDVARV